MARILFIFASVCQLLLPCLLNAQDAAPVPGIRILAGNLTSGKLQSYDPGHGSRILKALAPDLALLQEFRFGNNSHAQLAAWVASVFGNSYSFYGEKTELPNAVISRFEILKSGSWDDPEQVNRDFAWAHLLLPEGKKLLAVSVHLSAKNEEKRKNSALALVKEIGNSLEPKEFLVIGGDFNSQQRNEIALKILGKVVIVEKPFPQDGEGNENTNQGRNKPYDAVYVSPNLQQLSRPLNLGGGEGGLVFDSRIFSELAKVPPVEKEDSAAEQMQHMAVVRDFALP